MKKKNKRLVIILLFTLLMFHPLTSNITNAASNPYTVKNVSSQTYKNRWSVKKISKKELRTLAKIVYLEARDQGDKGEQAVIEVIFNRVASKKFPNTITKVLSQKNQFTTWKNLNRGKVRTKEIRNIYKVLKGSTNILSKKALFFSMGPYNKKIELHYKDHYFCRY